MKALLFISTVFALAHSSVSAQAPTPGQCDGSVMYEITYETAWTEDSTNAPIPENAHFSPAFVALHPYDTVLYAAHVPATSGIKLMAETGETSILEDEASSLGAIFAKGTKLNVQGITTVTLTATPEADLLTLVSMIAPSPDWFVGITSLSLCQSWEWIDSFSGDLASLDAGTDSGPDFASEDEVTDPAEPILYLTKDLSESSTRTDAVFGRVSIVRL